MSANWSIQIPADPTPKLVHVTQISANATEDKVKEFFLFCGKITAFQLRKDGHGTQEALIRFDKESAARTATMLSNAVIADSQISVAYYFSQYATEKDNIAAAADASAAGHDTQEAKPKTSIVTEIVAAGFTVSGAVFERAKEFDSKYGVSTRMQTYYQQALEKAQQLDQKYGLTRTVTERAGAIDAQYHVKDKVLDVAQKVAASGPGQMAQGVFQQAKDTVVSGKNLADEKKAAAAAAAPASDAAPAATSE